MWSIEPFGMSAKLSGMVRLICKGHCGATNGIRSDMLLGYAIAHNVCA